MDFTDNIKNLLFVSIVIVILTSCSRESKRVALKLPAETAIWDFKTIRKAYGQVLIPALEDSIINYSEADSIDRQFGHLCAQDTIRAKEFVLQFADAYKKGVKPDFPSKLYPTLKYANDTIYHSDENFYHH